MSEILLDTEAVEAWRQYLSDWEEQVYIPLFLPLGVGKDAALTTWFVNRLRNAIPDDNAGNDPWRD